MKKILQIDGGGIKGIIPSVICDHIEKSKNKKICDIFNLIIGTSSGAILGGALAAGVDAEKIKDIYINEGPKLFKSKYLLHLTTPQYERDKFKKRFKQEINDITLKELNTKYMATAFNLCSNRTHFIKSWNKNDLSKKLLDVISWSGLSAAHYFGKIDVPDYKWTLEKEDSSSEEKTGAVFQDGGQGIYNCTLSYVITECIAQGWLKDEVLILSLGSGCVDFSKDYKKMKKIGILDEVRYYTEQARIESTISQVLAIKYLAEKHKNIKIHRLEKIIPKNQNGLDKIKYIDVYEKIGKSLINKIPLNEL